MDEPIFDYEELQRLFVFADVVYTMDLDEYEEKLMDKFKRWIQYKEKF